MPASRRLSSIVRMWPLLWRSSVLLLFVAYIVIGFNPWRLVTNAFGFDRGQAYFFMKTASLEQVPEDYSLGWWNIKNAQGRPDLADGSAPEAFDDSNSAYYAGGRYSLILENITTQPEETLAEETFKVSSTTDIELASTAALEGNASSTIDLATSSDEIASNTPSEAIAPVDQASGTVEFVEIVNMDEPGEVMIVPTDNTSVPIEQQNQVESEASPAVPVEPTAEQPVVSEPSSDTPAPVEQPAPEVAPTEAASPSASLPINFLRNILGPSADANASSTINNPKESEYGSFDQAELVLSGAVKAMADLSLASSSSIVVWSSVGTDRKTDEPLWENVGTIDLTEVLRNRETVFSFPLDKVRSWDELDNLKIKLEGAAEQATPYQFFLDAVSVQVGYYRTDKELSEESQDKWSKLLTDLSDKKHFSAGEDVSLNFHYAKKQKTVAESLGITGNDYWDKVSVSAQLLDALGRNYDLPIDLVLSENGDISVSINKPGRNLKPGKYRLAFRFDDGTDQGVESIFIESEFTWGVLAMNTNKASYLSGETARMQFAALDDMGDTLCDADLTAIITLPDSSQIELSSSNGLIIANPDCVPNSVTYTPDYSAELNLSQIGEYPFRLTARTANGERTISDNFSVREYLPYEIERISATRIYPMSDYEMKIRIKFSEDFTGDIIETVPSGFMIYDLRLTNLKDGQVFENLQSTIENTPGTEGLAIKLNGVKGLKGDEWELSYAYDAPDISPEFYLLGPLRIGSFTEGRAWQIASDALQVKAKTVMFEAGTFSGDGTNGTSTNVNAILPQFDVRLAEAGVTIKNAFIVFEAHLESYAAPAAITRATTSVDFCDGACPANAWSGTSTMQYIDNTTIAYAEADSDMVRFVMDVTSEAQLSAYAGQGALLRGQFGFNFGRAVTVNSISAAKATLVITYTYNPYLSESITNTVVYPLESDVGGDLGTRRSSQADDCTLDTNCPLFSYKMDIPEFSSAAGSQNLSQWFKVYIQHAANTTNDITVNTNIQGTDSPSSNYIHEANAANTIQSNSLPMVFKNVGGYAENATQTLEISASSPGAPTYYTMGGEVWETYTASSSAPASTRTVSLPIGTINANAAANAAYSGSANVYFPENGPTATGTVKIRKAWWRITYNNSVNTASNFVVSTQVGNNSPVASSSYAYTPGATVVNGAVSIFHIIPSADYAELESANSSTSKAAILNVLDDAGNVGGISAELMITYAYTDQENGYLNNLQIFGGQTSFSVTSVSTSTATLLIPETIGKKTMRKAGLFASFIFSDNDGSIANGENFIHDANLAASGPICSNTYYSQSDSVNIYGEMIKDVTSVLGNVDGASFSACYSGTSAGDASGGMKGGGYVSYTYSWENTAPTGAWNAVATSTDASGKIRLTIDVDDANKDESRAMIQYATGTSCDFTSSGDPTFDASAASVSAAVTPKPIIDNGSAYQIGTSSAWILTTSANTVSFDWLSMADLPAADGTYCLQLTVNDSGRDQVAPATTTVVLDNVAPTSPGSLATGTIAARSVQLILGATSTDSHFSKYAIYYATGTSVTESGTKWIEYATALYDGQSSTTVTGLSPYTDYTFNIWAYDSYGQKASATPITAKTLSTVSNDSLTLLNPESGNNLVASPTKDWIFRAVISSVDGYSDIKDASLRLADDYDTVAPFSDLSFAWTRSSGLFVDSSTDAAGAVALGVSSSTCAANTCTIDYYLRFTNDFHNPAVQYSAELYSNSNADLPDYDLYSNLYQIRTIRVKQNHYRWRYDNGNE